MTGEHNPSNPAELLTVSQVCRRLPGARGARHVTPSTVTRWILTGCPARDGRRVRLNAIRVGGRWMIRPADLDGFFTALAAETAEPPVVQQTKKTEQRRRSSQRAADELARRGA